jgi:RNA polymerase subunit RPABC4/transcription elongation factor Spt4
MITLYGDNNFINDENGAFIFGPWWFVILVMVIGFIFSLSRNNNHKTKNTKHIYDYQTNTQPSNNLNNDNICPECGKNNFNNAKFCNGCGRSFVDNSDIFCPKCGEKNSKNSRFCQGCGAELDNI